MEEILKKYSGSIQNCVELVMWETIRRDCKYPESDNNNGYIYGLNLIDVDGEGDILDVQWFKTNEEREIYISENDLRVIEEFNQDKSNIILIFVIT